MRLLCVLGVLTDKSAFTVFMYSLLNMPLLFTWWLWHESLNWNFSRKFFKTTWNHYEYQEYISENPSLLWTLLHILIIFFGLCFCNSVYWRQRSTAGPWRSWSTLWCYSHSITLWPPLHLVAASTLTSIQMEDTRSGRPRSAVTAFVTLPMAMVSWRRCLETSRWDKGKCIRGKQRSARVKFLTIQCAQTVWWPRFLYVFS